MGSSALDPHTNFFGNFVDAHIELDFLEEFASTIDRLLQEAASKAEVSLSALPDSIAAVAEDRAELYAELFPPLVHEAFLISSAIFMEREMRDFVNALRFALRTTLTFSDLNGSALERFRTFAEKVCSLDLGLSDPQWQDLDGLFAIRNCLVHAFGLVEGFRQSAAVLAFIRRHDTPECANGRLKLSSDTSTVLLRLLREVVDAIYGAALARFPQEE